MSDDVNDAWHCDKCGKIRDASRLHKRGNLWICQWCLRERRSNYERVEGLMQTPPVTKPKKARHAFADDTTVILTGLSTKEEIAAKRIATVRSRYSRWPRVRRISLAEYESKAKAQDERKGV